MQETIHDTETRQAIAERKGCHVVQRNHFCTACDYFGNSSDRAVETDVILSGSMDLEIWDPMNGRIRSVEETHSQSKDGRELTTVPLTLSPVSALFYVEKR